MVDADRLEAVSSELRTSIPADIQEAREILKQKDSIINQAHLEARRVKESAGREDAQRRSYRMVEEAEAVAAIRREGADQYAKETLFDLEERLAHQLGQVRRGIDTLGLEVDNRVPS